MRPPAFAATTVHGSDGPRVHLSGELDIAAVDRLRDELRRARESRGPVTLDLSDLTFLGVAGVEEISRAAHDVGREGRDLVIVSSRPAVLDLLLRLGFDDLFRVDRGRRGRRRSVRP